jgi:glycosyltransferase involved in cell wall biosynthesis
MKVCVVGAGTRFMSGLSYYTLRLSNALAEEHHQVSAILMRQLMPARWYPGRGRVGQKLTDLSYSPKVSLCDGVDWFWLPGMLHAIVLMLKQRPQLVIFQWWTGTVLHSYLLLAVVARLLGARVVFEFHEIQDAGEADMRLARLYMRLLAPVVVALAHAGVVHAEQDKPLLQKQFRFYNKPIVRIEHGPYDQYQKGVAATDLRTGSVSTSKDTQDQPMSTATTSVTVTNLLFFGLIRPYKGLDDLLLAFNALPPAQAANFWLTIAGETWEGFDRPAQLIAASPYRERITFINRYVTDNEVAALFSAADAVVFPYRRSSGSGVLQIALSYGLPVITTNVGGLSEAVSNYAGALQVAPGNVGELSESILQVSKRHGQRYKACHSWRESVRDYETLYTLLLKPAQAKTKNISNEVSL